MIQQYFGEKEKIENEIDKILENENIGILVVTEKVNELAKEKLDYIKNNRKLPLIVQM